MLYGITTVFGSPQVPVAELLARPVPALHSPSVSALHGKKSSNFLQVPEIEAPDPSLSRTLQACQGMEDVFLQNYRNSKEKIW